MHLFTGVSMKGFVGEVNLDKHQWYMNSVHVGFVVHSDIYTKSSPESREWQCFVC